MLMPIETNRCSLRPESSSIVSVTCLRKLIAFFLGSKVLSTAPIYAYIAMIVYAPLISELRPASAAAAPPWPFAFPQSRSRAAVRLRAAVSWSSVSSILLTSQRSPFPSESYVPFCELAILETLSGERSEVEDPALRCRNFPIFLTGQQGEIKLHHT